MHSARLVGAGVFVLGGALLFTTALFLIGERRMLFEDRFSLYTEFAALGQLELGATVRVAGLEAGEVADILIPSSPAQKFRVRMEVREDLHQLIRTDSIATTQTEGLVGAVFVNIGPGSEAAPPVPEGGTIPSREPFQLSDLMLQASASIALVTETVEMLRGDVQVAVEQLALTAEDAHALIEQLRPDIVAMAENGRRISADTRDIMAAVNEGRGTIGKLVHDDALYERARELADQAAHVMANVREVSEEARRALADFRAPDGQAQGLMADMRVTVAGAREAVGDLADNMEALKHNFFLRGFFNRRGYFDLDNLSPADYREGVLENGGRKAMRIWLSSDVLFEGGPGGERLTDAGRVRLDSAMATYLDYIPGSPLVVEGYATAGTTAERYRRARARAAAAHDYLLSRYELPPQQTGYIALGGEAKGSPAGGEWDGVALTLFLDAGELRFADRQAARRVAPVLDD